MQRSSPSHAQFFTSLRHLEKRLKLEDPQLSPPATSPPPEPEKTGDATQQTDSLGTPIYLAFNDSTSNTTPSDPQESEAPREFLSNSPDFSPTPRELPPENHSEPGRPTDRTEIDDEIEQLMELLRLPECEELNEGAAGIADLGGDNGFYGKIVGVKGPKSGKEAERLDGWIEHFAKKEVEPLRLAHLLLVKAAFVHSEESDFGGFEFPSTIQEFLQTDPPATE